MTVEELINILEEINKEIFVKVTDKDGKPQEVTHVVLQEFDGELFIELGR